MKAPIWMLRFRPRAVAAHMIQMQPTAAPALNKPFAAAIAFVVVVA